MLKDLWALLTFRAWVCRLTRCHCLVPVIPMCFRCLAEWPTWDDVPH